VDKLFQNENTYSETTLLKVSCGSLIVDLAVKFTSIVTEDWVISVFRTATKSGTLREFSVNASSIVGIAPVIQTTTSPPVSKTTPTTDGMYMYLTEKKRRPIALLVSAEELVSILKHSAIFSKIFLCLGLN